MRDRKALLATPKQIEFIYHLSAELEFGKRELFMLTGGKKPEEIDRKKASEVIEHLKRLRKKEGQK